MPNRPDFVIAGAARCGTTALFEYLSRHPSIFTPRLKEPAFFCTDLPGGISAAEEYYSLFASAPARCLAGEASTRYLYSKVAIGRIMANNAQTNVIVILRNPVDAAYSMHGYAYRYGHESNADFEEAWRAQLARPLHGPDTQTFEYAYGPTYRYAEQIERLLHHVPERQRYVAIYEEFFADPAGHFARIVEFLDLPPAPPIDFSKVNEHAAVRLPAVEQALRRPPDWLKAFYAPFRPLFRTAGLHPTEMTRKLNFARQRRPALRPEFRAELMHYYAEDIAQLEKLLGRTTWR